MGFISPPVNGVLQAGDCSDKNDQKMLRSRLKTRTGLRPNGPKDSHALAQTKHCSRPCSKMSLGKSMPMNTILLILISPSAHIGPKSLPMSWCTP